MTTPDPAGAKYPAGAIRLGQEDRSGTIMRNQALRI
jgi:hypothetical protein